MLEPARRAGVDFADSAVRKLSEDLSRIRVQRPDGIRRATWPQCRAGSFRSCAGCGNSCRMQMPSGIGCRIGRRRRYGVAAYCADRVKAVAQAAGVRDGPSATGSYEADY
jgi:hypothetical protein